VNETQQKQQDADEAVQLVTGVLLIAFALVGVAALLAVQVSHVLSR
jgi:hypothetical protein